MEMDSQVPGGAQGSGIPPSKAPVLISWHFSLNTVTNSPARVHVPTFLFAVFATFYDPLQTPRLMAQKVKRIKNAIIL